MSQATIQVTVSICPECGGGLKLNPNLHYFRCFYCGKIYKIISLGQTEREFICEVEDEGNRKDTR